LAADVFVARPEAQRNAGVRWFIGRVIPGFRVLMAEKVNKKC